MNMPMMARDIMLPSSLFPPKYPCSHDPLVCCLTAGTLVNNLHFCALLVLYCWVEDVTRRLPGGQQLSWLGVRWLSVWNGDLL